MSFEVGNKVRIIAGNSLDKAWHDVEGVITEIIPGAPWPLRVGNFTTAPDIDKNIGEVFISPLEAELIEEEPAEVAPVLTESQAEKVAAVSEYLGNLRTIYTVMSKQLQDLGDEYPAAIYLQVGSEVGKAKKVLDSFNN